jgi:hypothetical protein
MMPEVVKFSSVETLRDGRRVEIRALRREDRNGLEEAVSRASAESLRRRFFSVRRHFSEQELEFFSNIDLVSHVALVVVADEGGGPVIVGGGRYIDLEPGRAEVAFALIDEYQGQGIGATSCRNRPGCRAQGIDRRSLAGEHCDVESFQEERIAADDETRSRHYACDAPALLRREFNLPRAAKFWWMKVSA